MGALQKIESFPLWLRIKDIPAIFGISRSLVYELIEDDSILTVSLKKKKAKRGIRLVNVESLNNFILLNLEIKEKT